MVQGFNKCKSSFKFENLPRNDDAISCPLQSEYRWIRKLEAQWAFEEKKIKINKKQWQIISLNSNSVFAQ
jgi:hypothetical protein